MNARKNLSWQIEDNVELTLSPGLVWGQKSRRLSGGCPGQHWRGKVPNQWKARERGDTKGVPTSVRIPKREAKMMSFAELKVLVKHLEFLAVESLGVILKMKVGVGGVASGPAGPLHEAGVEVWERSRHSGRGSVLAGMANPQAFGGLAKHADAGRRLRVRLCGLEASLRTHHPWEASGFLSFYDLTSWVASPGPQVWQERPEPPQTLAIKSGQDRSWAKSQAHRRRTSQRIAVPTGVSLRRSSDDKIPCLMSLPWPHQPEMADTQVSF